MPRSLLIPAAAVLAVAVWPAGPATADATCAGVRVVVAPPSGPEAVGCVAEASGTAAEIFEDAGHRLDRVERFPGAVCRVDGLPADDPCVAMPPADASWGFFDTAGEDPGAWHYATAGVDAVEPGPGTAVALVWQDDERPEPPRTAAGGGAAASDAPPQTSPDGTDAALPAWAPYAGAGLLAVVALALLGRRRT